MEDTLESTTAISQVAKRSFQSDDGRPPKRQAVLLLPTRTEDESTFDAALVRGIVDFNIPHTTCEVNGVTSDLICFGAIVDVPIQVRQDPLNHVTDRAKSVIDQTGCVLLDFTLINGLGWVSLDSAQPFGCLTWRTSGYLKRLRSIQCIEIDIVTPLKAAEICRASWKKTGNAAILKVDINVYGHTHCAEAVDKILNAARVFLQRPEIAPRPVFYDNPQYLQLPEVHNVVASLPSIPDLMEEVSLASSTETTDAEVEAVLDDLIQPNFLRQISTDNRVLSPLIKHQKEAVDFMDRRETGDLPSSMSLWSTTELDNGTSCYQHVITKTKSACKEEVAGGILADDMGLGKTLSMLAVIVASLQRALDTAVSGTTSATYQWDSLVPAKTTLVIVPSALLLDSWTDEIRKHITPGALRTYRYHGSGKQISLLDLLQHDIVLTTYATIASDFCRRQRSILSHVEWYRLVLDEAHVIRNPSTKQFRAICSLAARIRWCITGTPIQNGVGDLATLIRFLRVPVLLESSTFRRHITAMTQSSKPGRFANLRRLLECLCLRRTKTLLQLPDPVTDTQRLSLSPSEMKMYKDYGDSCKQALDRVIFGKGIKKANQIIIESLLRMRLFCNHGAVAFSGKWNASGLPSDPQEVWSYLQAHRKETICARCDGEISMMYQNDDQSSGVLTICHHLLCGECLPTFRRDLEASVQDGITRCPDCDQRGELESFIIEPTRTPETPDQTRTSYSTKLLALLKNIQQHAAEEKCVVFSFWKKTLDIVAELLTANNITFLRVHGSLSASKRASILAEFEANPSIKALLITFGTGAVGINKLVVANHIHIIEPQWNPGVENQAIGRVLRFGQERSVTIVRYIMKGTVETAVQSKQLRKLQLARGGFGLNKDDVHTSQRIEEIMSLLCPSTTK